MTEVVPGQNVTVTGSGFPPGEPLVAELFSDPVRLGTTVADGFGRFRMVVTVPLGTSPGLHTLRVRAVNGVQFASVSLLVTAPAPGSTMRAAGTLSRTGADLLRRVGWGFMLMATGGLMVRLAWNGHQPAGFGRRRPPWPSRRHWA